MAKSLLSDQFRERLQSLGSNLGAHTRSIEQHFENQEAFLALRHQELEDAANDALSAAKGAAEELEAAPVTARKDDAPAADQAAMSNVAGWCSISVGGGLIQTTSG